MSPTAPVPAATPDYLNDSLRWVAAEVRFPPLDELATAIPQALREQIREQFPVSEEQQQLTISIGPGGPAPQQGLQHRFSRRDRLMSVTVGRDVMTLEATEYPGWSGFRNQLVAMLESLEDVSRPDGIVRVGLRYIDEIRLPQPPASLLGWTDWIDERLVAPFSLDDAAEPTNATIMLQYGMPGTAPGPVPVAAPPGFVTAFRAAPFASGRAVQPEGPLRMPFPTPDGPFFLLDTDASWTDPERQVPEFASDRIASILDELHAPCVRLFEAAITDRLRDEVLRPPREEVWAT